MRLPMWLTSWFGQAKQEKQRAALEDAARAADLWEQDAARQRILHQAANMRPTRYDERPLMTRGQMARSRYGTR